eukprot:TRINITY_DN26855_c0_g1_i2.p1 TRINITY_DN26855_c0_g1~~TRINITY_DN26855_c0_g1_i2.p1  ORF type:complete len:168 (-),score=41.41 TRINITY_DN26855_c0_g1_i2:322-825(-)
MHRLALGSTALLWAAPAASQGEHDHASLALAADDACSLSAESGAYSSSCSLGLMQLSSAESSAERLAQGGSAVQRGKGIPADGLDIDSHWRQAAQYGRFNGQTCVFNQCDQSRGPSDCSFFKCLCKEGFVAVAGECRPSSEGPVTALGTSTGESCYLPVIGADFAKG